MYDEILFGLIYKRLSVKTITQTLYRLCWTSWIIHIIKFVYTPRCIELFTIRGKFKVPYMKSVKTGWLDDCLEPKSIKSTDNFQPSLELKVHKNFELIG